MSEKIKIIALKERISSDTETPITVLEKLKKFDPIYLLESVEGGENLARYSFLGFNPMMSYKFRDGKADITYKDVEQKKVRIDTTPLEGIEKALARYEMTAVQDLEGAGVVGYLGYDAIRYYEAVQMPSETTTHIPESYFVLCRLILVFDHAYNTLTIIHLGKPEDNDAIKKQINLVKATLAKPHQITSDSISPQINSKFKSNLTFNQFSKMVTRAKEYINSGDIFQVVLSQRFEVSLTSTPLDIYRSLRRINPSPYMYYLQFDDFKIVGSSPEVLVKKEDQNISLRPIAGTRHRGATLLEDNRLEKELLADEKERAEHLMLVDLGRNDLGRVSKIGTVAVEKFMQIERYSHVMHMVSLVTGKIDDRRNAYDLVKSSFPAGTVSGAPKIRAMNIIGELESERRGIYAGAICNFSLNGDLNSCITIRTIIIKDKMAYVQAGAGIVADSNPYNEYMETCNKAKVLLKALGCDLEELNRAELRREEMSRC
ncbi:anthranilate synthase component 1 [Desulfitispora alkaliphila]|uniref:anthranilate synthase component I n=1 Tax=Desulfitispora alkaliphila TaxID=622674 RepID=UPI003D24EC77